MDIKKKLQGWRDPEFRFQQTDCSFPLLDHPVGQVGLPDEELEAVGGTATLTPSLTFTGVFGCFTINNTACNGTCGVRTSGCCDN